MSEPEFDWHVYLPVDDAAIARGLYVTGLGRARAARGSAYPPAEHPGAYNFSWTKGRVLCEYAAVLISEGKGNFESDAVAFHTFDAPRLMLLTPGNWHRYRPAQPIGWTEHWVCFSGEIAPRLLDLAPAEANGAPRAVVEADCLRARFDRMIDETRGTPRANGPTLVAGLLETLGAAFGSLLGPGTSGDASSRNTRPLTSAPDSLVSAAREIIWTRSHGRLSSEEIARRLGVSRRKLERRFAECEAGTVLGEIQACRLSRAKRLLVETRLSVKEIAYMAGFPTPERMRVAFQGSLGLSPSEFRRQATD